jgi:hypothetical protein
MATVPVAAKAAAPTKPDVPAEPARSAGGAAGVVPGLDALRVPAKGRIVAIGDVHGDLSATRRALVLAGAIDEKDRWRGGDLVVVQVGDQLDRGDDEQAILDLFDRLMDEAKADGGAFVPLNGNHEVMNVLLDFRYVTPGGMRDFDGVADATRSDAKLAGLPEDARARAAAFLPGGPYAKILAERHIAAIVGDTVFVHAGILPSAVDDLVATDAGLRSLLAGERNVGSATAMERAMELAMDPAGPLWARDFAADDDPSMCAQLGDSLARLGCKRMVIGHTVQEDGITSACEGRVWRIDVGLAAHYGGPTQVLEIVGDEVRVLGAKP